jgi:hypothetical protein
MEARATRGASAASEVDHIKQLADGGSFTDPSESFGRLLWTVGNKQLTDGGSFTDPSESFGRLLWTAGR